MKKIILCLLCGVLLLGVTGCGSSDTKYTDNMEEMRSITIGYLGDSTLGKLLDKAIKGASWKEDENYSSTSGAIIITGKDKNTKGSVELVWLTTPDSAENGFESLKIDDIDRIYSKKHFLIHRLDKDTEGILIVGKTSTAAAKYSKILNSPETKKEYIW